MACRSDLCGRGRRAGLMMPSNVPGPCKAATCWSEQLMQDEAKLAPCAQVPDTSLWARAWTVCFGFEGTNFTRDEHGPCTSTPNCSHRRSTGTNTRFVAASSGLPVGKFPTCTSR